MASFSMTVITHLCLLLFICEFWRFFNGGGTYESTTWNETYGTPVDKVWEASCFLEHFSFVVILSYVAIFCGRGGSTGSDCGNNFLIGVCAAFLAVWHRWAMFLKILFDLLSRCQFSCGVASNQRLFGGVGYLTTLGVGVGYFVRLRLRKPNGITFTSHS